MKAQLQQWIARFDALSGRERMLVAVTLLAGVVFTVWQVWIDPDWMRIRRAEQSLVAQQMLRQSLQQQIAALESPTHSPDALAREEIEALKKRLEETGSRLSALESALVPPQRMTALLESMIGGRSGVRLLSLRTLPVVPVLEKKEAGGKVDPGKAGSGAEKTGAAGDMGGLFKHGVELRLEGSYADLAEYLTRLEKQPQKLLWSSVALTTEKTPKAVLTLTVFTLSLDRAWLVF